MSQTIAGLRRLAARSVIFTVADFLRLAIAFFLIPLYTAHLAPADYGILTIARTLTSILTILYLQSLESAYVRFHYDHDDDARRREFYGSVWLVHLAFTTVASIVIELAGRNGYLTAILGIPYDPYGRLALWTAFLTASVLLLPRALFLAREQAWRYAGFNIAMFLFSVVAIIYLVAVRQRGAAGSLEATFLVTAALSIPAAVVILRNVRLRIHLPDVQAAFAYALPLVPHLLSLWVLSLADRLILQRYTGLAGVGIYSLGYQLGSIPDLFAFAIATAVDPFFIRTANSRPDAPAILTKLATWYLLVVICAGVATVGFAPELLDMMPSRPGYEAALAVVPWIALASVMRGFYFVFLAALMYGKQVKSLPLITATAAAVNVGLNLLLVPRFGYIVAAVTTVVAYAIQCVLLYWRAKRAYAIPYEWRRLALLVVAGIGWAAMLWTISLPQPVMSLLLKVVVLAMFPAALVLLRFFPAAELRSLSPLWTRR